MDLNATTLEKLDGDPAVSRQVLAELESMARQATAPGQDARRAEIASFLATELNAVRPGGKNDKGEDKPPVQRYSARVRNTIAQLLGIVGGPEQVAALALALLDLDLRESARCALDRIDSSASTSALILSLGASGPRFRAGVVNSLAARGGERVVKVLQSLVSDEDQEVRMAAVDAMAKIPDASSDAVLAGLAEAPCPCTRQAASKARIRLAEKLAQAGDGVAARRIYQAIRNSEADAAQKKAAELGLAAMK